MTMFKIFAGAAGLAAFAAAAPAAAQYGYPQYGASPYAPYGNAYGYQSNMTNVAVQRCTAAVQQRLSTRVGIAGILGSVIGAPVATGRVLNITDVRPRTRQLTRVRGLANSGQSPYGVGAYGAVGYAYQPDLSFKCDVDAWGRVRDLDINRRR
jgi:hypothetical protein